MQPSTTRWRITPVGWLVVGAAVVAESISNALRSYALGQHLERFTVTVGDARVSVAGGVLVLGAVALSLAQARAAWLALMPGQARQRLVALPVAVLLLAVSAVAMSSHILEAQRVKAGDEKGADGDYTRLQQARTAAAAEYETIGPQRPVDVIQAEVTATRIDAAVWRRSMQCSDISRDDTRAACLPILALYKERGAAARRSELAGTIAALDTKLAGKKPVEQAPEIERTTATAWAWAFGAAVVLLATFGSVLFARPDAVVPAVSPAPAALPPPADDDDHGDESLPPKSKRECLADLLTLTAFGKEIPSQEHLRQRWGMAHKGTVSKWLREWEDQGLITRTQDHRCKAVSA